MPSVSVKSEIFIKRLKEEVPGWLVNKKYLCLFCGFQPLYLEDNICPYSDCHHDATFSVIVGIIILSTLEAERKNSQADTKDKELYKKIEAIYNETINVLEIKLETIKVTFDQVFSYYCGQHNQDLDNLAQSISKISVRGLFGYNSYDFNIDRELSMICGSNGLGKTTIFKLLEYTLVRPQYKQRTTNELNKDYLDDFELEQRLRWLFELPFDKFRIEFKNGYFVSVEKSRDNKELIFDQTVFGFNGKDQRCVISSNDSQEERMSKMKRHYDNVDRLFPNINKQAKFLFVKTNRLYDLDYSMAFMAVASNSENTSKEIDDEKNLEQAKEYYDVFNRIARLLDMPSPTIDYYKKLQKQINELLKVKEYYDVFNHIARLLDKPLISNLFDMKCCSALPLASYNFNQKHCEISMADYFNYLDKHANDKEMKLFRNSFDESFKKSNLLESLKNTSGVYASSKGTTIGWSNVTRNILERIHQCLSTINSLTSQNKKEKVISLIFEELLKVPQAVLSNDCFCLKFKRLLDFYDKFMLFKNLYEGLYYDNDPAAKKISIEGNDIVFKTNKTLNNDFSMKLSVKSLSSGELNIVTILYYLIFETTRGSIVLIDEPEISLHVVWQEQLSVLIEKIMESKPGVQVIIATHSPFISSSDENCYIGATLVKDELKNE